MKKLLSFVLVSTAALCCAVDLFTAGFDSEYVTPSVVTGIVQDVVSDLPAGIDTNAVIDIVNGMDIGTGVTTNAVIDIVNGMGIGGGISTQDVRNIVQASSITTNAVIDIVDELDFATSQAVESALSSNLVAVSNTLNSYEFVTMPELLSRWPVHAGATVGSSWVSAVGGSAVGLSATPAAGTAVITNNTVVCGLRFETVADLQNPTDLNDFFYGQGSYLDKYGRFVVEYYFESVDDLCDMLGWFTDHTDLKASYPVKCVVTSKSQWSYGDSAVWYGHLVRDGSTTTYKLPILTKHGVEPAATRASQVNDIIVTGTSSGDANGTKYRFWKFITTTPPGTSMKDLVNVDSYPTKKDKTKSNYAIYAVLTDPLATSGHTQTVIDSKVASTVSSLLSDTSTDTYIYSDAVLWKNDAISSGTMSSNCGGKTSPSDKAKYGTSVSKVYAFKSTVSQIEYASSEQPSPVITVSDVDSIGLSSIVVVDSNGSDDKYRISVSNGQIRADIITQ